jgi:hypothetical protein
MIFAVVDGNGNASKIATAIKKNEDLFRPTVGKERLVLAVFDEGGCPLHQIMVWNGRQPVGEITRSLHEIPAFKDLQACF